MTRRFRLLAALILITSVGLTWPSAVVAQRHAPSGGGGHGGGHGGGVAVPRTYSHGGYGTHTYYRPYTYSRYYYPYSYSRYYSPWYYSPFYAGVGFGIGFGFGWSGGYWGGYGGYGYPYASGYPYPYQYGYPYAPPYGYQAPYNGYGPTGSATQQAPYNGYGPTGSVTQQRPEQPVNPSSQAYIAQRQAPQYAAAPQGGFGTLSLRVSPADAVITVDGTVWDRPEGDSRFSIDLPEGPHRVEIRRQGYAPYSRVLDVRSGGPLTLNVSLSVAGPGQSQINVRTGSNVARTVPMWER